MSADLAAPNVAALEQRLRECEETLEAIRRGDIDALLVHGHATPRVYTLESADRPYRVLIEQIQEGAVTLAPDDGTIFYANRRLTEMLGVAQEKAIGRKLADFLPQSERAGFAALLAEAQTERASGEFTLIGADGHDVPIAASMGLLRADDADPLVCGVLADLTRQRDHMQELSEANARLRDEIVQRQAAEEALRQSQKMEAVGQLTGGLAHDFNNLLTGIVGALELLQKRAAQGRLNDAERYIEAAQGAAQRAAALTHRLLAFSRRQTLDPRPTDVNALIEGLAELVRRTVGPEYTIVLQPEPGLWQVLVDPGQLENAVLNLCINGRDAMEGGGDLIVATENRGLDAEAAAAADLPAGDYVVLRVEDRGSGMPPEVMARAFNPFFTTKPLGVGTGLGLSMVYGFVRQSGGQVRIRSVVGEGTAVCLYLPRLFGAVEVPVPREVPRQTDLARTSGGLSVLVVDDEPTVRMLIGDVLDQMGCAALEAATGAAGLTILRSEAQVDLLISDVGLPGGMNGRQLADQARAFRPDLKILFITGYAETPVIDPQTPQTAPTQILTKPFSMENLATKVRQMLTS